ncbi:site-specific DNA-methyltransferase [Aequorivita capsosiphonis]|uniref:site-specific DNA-methyltransferase n=1 Tax=Aequorivita capsosiphonis TaxID=487317 RepID=UPI000551C702|nr:site-specific DNA-methyltransferase [Aequorivita capsosiphonis]
MKTKKKLLNVIYNQDARNILESIGSKTKVTTTITSPPYYDMKDYDSDNQVGYGQTYEDYLKDLKSIFAGVFEITEENGTLWIIIDTFKRNNQVITLPFDLSDKLKEVGWLLQDVIIWKKDKTVPWSTNGFMQRKFEYILFFSKSINYKSNKDSVRVYDTSQLKKWWIKYPERYNPKGKALDEVWEFPIPTQGSWGDEYIRHFCPLPQDMVATMIQISTDENDNILDPFAGSGTVLSQSAYMNRNYIGFELNEKYISMFEEYLEKTFSKYRKEYDQFSQNKDQGDFEKRILNLRSLKFARVLGNNIEKNIDFDNFKIFVVPKEASKIKNKLLRVEYQIIGQIDETIFLNEAKKLINKAPLSKFGIEPIFKFVISKKFNNKDHFGYTKTNTYSYVKNADLNSPKIKVISKICVDLNENDYL